MSLYLRFLFAALFFNFFRVCVFLSSKLSSRYAITVNLSVREKQRDYLKGCAEYMQRRFMFLLADKSYLAFGRGHNLKLLCSAPHTVGFVLCYGRIEASTYRLLLGMVLSR
jgi:hypothetical protein